MGPFGIIASAQIAQLVEQWTENPRVAGSIPALGTKDIPILRSVLHAGIAHLVERHLAKVEVASSSLVARSKKKSPSDRMGTSFWSFSVCCANRFD